MDKKYDSVRLENHLGFPLYACSKEVIRLYKPYLDELEVTYTQYITMMVMWEQKEISVKQLGEYLYLDSGTLTPVLKTLEAKGYVTRARSKADERVLMVTITVQGLKLRDRALKVTQNMDKSINLTTQENRDLIRILNKILSQVE